MKKFIYEGSKVRPFNHSTDGIMENIPPGIYVVKIDLNGYFLEKVNTFTIPNKVYGNTVSRAQRIITTFKKRTQSTGVLLTGEKGSGKTLLAKTISNLCLDEGLVTIIVNEEYSDDNFCTLIQGITQPVVFVFDEFEKVYSDESQQKILTILDGVFNSKKLYIFTSNNVYRVNEHMKNRPGRIFYLLEFKGLEDNFIREYCEDNLNDKTHIENVLKVSKLFEEFNFDMLQALIEEMNRYNESPMESMALLNAKPHMSDYVKFDVSAEICGIKFDDDMYFHYSTFRQFPLNKTFNVVIEVNEEKLFNKLLKLTGVLKSAGIDVIIEGDKASPGDEDVYREYTITLELDNSNLVEVNHNDETFIYKLMDGDITVTYKRKRYNAKTNGFYELMA